MLASTTSTSTRTTLQAVLVLEVVFSAFYVSDDTEFEFIKSKIMGFRFDC